MPAATYYAHMNKYHPGTAHVRKHNPARQMTAEQREEHEAALKRRRNKKYWSRLQEGKVMAILC